MQLKILREAGFIDKVSGDYCYFNDPLKLATTVDMAANWPNPPGSVFIRVPDKDIYTFAKLKNPPRTLAACEGVGEYPRQSFDPAFGKPGDAQGPHRHVIAATGRTGTSIQYALPVEVDDNKTLPWGFIAISNEDTSEQFCTVTKVIQVDAVLPEKPSVPAADAQQVAQICAKTSATTCGTLPDLIRAFRGRVLMQGREVHRFPGSGLAQGPLLTVVGQTGKSSLTVLSTAANGVTRVAFQH